jgi:hypothetical protein
MEVAAAALTTVLVLQALEVLEVVERAQLREARPQVARPIQAVAEAQEERQVMAALGLWLFDTELDQSPRQVGP